MMVRDVDAKSVWGDLIILVRQAEERIQGKGMGPQKKRWVLRALCGRPSCDRTGQWGVLVDAAVAACKQGVRKGLKPSKRRK